MNQERKVFPISQAAESQSLGKWLWEQLLWVGVLWS